MSGIDERVEGNLALLAQERYSRGMTGDATKKLGKRTLGGEIEGLRRDFSDNPSLRGNEFERVFCHYLRTRSDIKNAWLRSEWPELHRHFRDAKDSGFDLVAEQHDGTLIAIQCKLIDPNAESNIDDVRALTGGSGNHAEPFSKLWWVSTGGLTPDAEKVRQQRKVHVFNIYEHWDAELDHQREPHKPLLLQERAIRKSVIGLSKKDEKRGKLIMACGTGKTFASLKIAEGLAAGGLADSESGVQNVLFAVPSIALASQAMKEWYDNSVRNVSFLAVCSDKGVWGGSNSEDNVEGGESDSMYPVTTDPENIAKFLKKDISSNVLRVVFTTYQSIDKVGEAQKQHGAPSFHLIIADEAHRTTGVDIGDTSENVRQFKLIHYDEYVKGEKRLYMTASPRIYKTQRSSETVTITNMDDDEIYGQQLDHVSFHEAVEAGILCDYRLICFGIHEEAVGVWAREMVNRLNMDDSYGKKGKGADEKLILSILSVLLSINGNVRGNLGEEPPGVLPRTLAYASNIRRSKQTKTVLEGTDEDARNVLEEHADYTNLMNPKVYHVDGTDRMSHRMAALNNLKHHSSKSAPVLITNAKLFSEGIDIPSLDAIAFLDPCKSIVDTIQRVGRVMRRDREGGDKRFGYIIVPIILPPNKSAMEVLEEDSGRFKVVGDVLNAIQSNAGDVIIDVKDKILYEEYSSEPKPIADGQEDTSDKGINEELDFHLKTLFLKISDKFGIGNAKKAVAITMEGTVRQAAKRLMNEGAADKFKRVIGTVSEDEKVVCDIGAVMLVNACLIHKRLEDEKLVDNLPTLESIHNEDDVIGALHDAWTSIMKKDYVQVFNGAAKMIHDFRGNKNAGAALRQLMTCAENNIKTIVDYGFDHIGMLFNRLVEADEAKSDGMFFTESTTAQLMAGLLYDKDFCDWRDMEAVRNLRIADPTCGSGTLLLASLNAIKRQAQKAQNLSEEEVTALHKHLVENTIYGYDINPYSIQFAASNMTFGSPTADYENMNLFQVKHGIGENGEARQGSLEFLLADTDTVNLGDIKDLFGELTVEAISLSGRLDTVFAATNLNAVIANPPFTDTSKANTKIEQEKKKMDERLEDIKKSLSVEEAKAIAKMSVQPFFTPLINRMVDKNNGAFGMIVPTTVCTAENAAGQRRYIALNFDIDLVVTSHDAKHANMSLRTSINESFIVCRRSDGKNRPTRFIQLARAPENAEETEKLIDAIQSGKTKDLYAETLWDADKVRNGDWSPCQWLNPSLPNAVLHIENLPNLLVSGERYSWTPEGQRVRGHFKWDTNIKIGKDMPRDGNIFRSIDMDIMQTMDAKPETKATPRKGKEKTAERDWQGADHALIVARFRTTSTLLTAIYSEKKALGSAFRPIGVFDKQIAKAYVAFLNSSFGVIQLLNRRSGKLDYPAFETGHLRTLRLPDTNKVSIDNIVRVFEAHKNTPLERLCDCVADPVRKALDYAVAEALGVDRKLTDQWREWLSKEPTITGKQYEGKLPPSSERNS